MILPQLKWHMTLIPITLALAACNASASPPKPTEASEPSQRPPPPPEDQNGSSPGGGADARRAPPEEAFAACTDKKEGDSCSVKFNGEVHDGTCRKGPPDAQDSRLACMPKHGPPGGPPHQGAGAPPGHSD